MKWVKSFNEMKEEKVKDQEMAFNAKSLVNEGEPSITTDIEDQEKTEKEFNKEMDKVEKSDLK